MPEPERLSAGKRFHREVQEEWHREAQGEVTDEKHIRKPSGRKGRIDIHVEADSELVAVVEIKHSDWDRMAPHRIRPNVKRYARQLWEYIEAELSTIVSVSPGIVFPKTPSIPGRLDLIEDLFDNEGIPVVWQNESISDHRERSESPSEP